MSSTQERKYRIIVVDDDAVDRRLYRRLLAPHARALDTIVEARNGVQGLASLRSQEFECLLLDYRLPDMTGLEFLAHSLTDDGELLCATILITGQGDEALAVNAMKVGAQDYLVKNAITGDSLWRAITGSVTQQDLRQRLASSLRDLTSANIALTHEIATRSLVEGKLAASNLQLEQLAMDLEVARGRAEQANQAKSRFLAGVTHELRTPLHGILGLAELLTLEGSLNQTQSQHLLVMMTTGRHLLETINAVLDMSQIEADYLLLQDTKVDIVEIVRSCLDVVRSAAVAKGLALAMQPSTPLHIMADPMRLRQIVLNLLGNAIKFTSTGSVEIRLQPVDIGAYVRLEVVDTGPGVWAKHREKLFQPFERLNAETVKGIEGSGLGLAIASRLISLMRGHIGYSDNPGGGSVFWFELPQNGLDLLAPIELAPPPRCSLVGIVAQPLRVLVVDDEALNRSIAAGFLRLAGHEVVCVNGGTAAVEAAMNEDFDVILMDVRMPGVDGLEATRLIRSLPPPRSGVRIVAVTAQAFAQQIGVCLCAGMNSHISKPFHQAELLAILEDQLLEPALGRVPRQLAVTPEFPLFDPATFEDNTGCMPLKEVQKHLGALIRRCELLLRDLRREGPVGADDQIEKAHSLAGGAGSFGFLWVAEAARLFEGCANAESAMRLVATIEATMPAIVAERARCSARRA